MDEQRLNRFGADRLTSRQIDELIGLARGIVADGSINLAEAEFLQKWLAANSDVTDQPLIRVLYDKVSDMLGDGAFDDGEHDELLETLNSFSRRDFELGEVLKATSLPLCQPSPALTFTGMRYCFTGTFMYGKRKDCEAVIAERGGVASSLTQKTDFLVIGMYATESWKHSSFGNKILQACEWRDAGLPIKIVSEEHWTSHL